MFENDKYKNKGAGGGGGGTMFICWVPFLLPAPRSTVFLRLLLRFVT